MRHVADALCPKEAPCQILSQHDLRQRSYKVRNLMSFQLAKHHGTTSCYQKHLLLLRLLVIGSTLCYLDYLLLLRVLLVVERRFCQSESIIHLALSPSEWRFACWPLSLSCHVSLFKVLLFF